MEDRVNDLCQKFDSFAKKGHIDLPAFHDLNCQLEQKPIQESESRMVFNGIDIDNSKLISKQEFVEYIRAVLDNNQVQIFKIVFRAFDKNRNRVLEPSEVAEICRFANKELTPAELDVAIETLTGSKQGKITFPQLLKFITGMEIDPKTDPYDGKLKSGCCLIL